MHEKKKTVVIETADQFWRASTRRDFLRVLGIGGTAVLLPSVFGACDDDDDPTGNNGGNGAVTLNLGSEVGILNYAFALEQLEAGFYETVIASAAFTAMNGELREVFTDLRNHEVAHREFFRAVIPASSRIGTLAFNTTTLNTTINGGVASVLKAAETFEDLGVAAYNGAGKYLTAGNLLLAGKIVSVEARHAAAIRDIRGAAPYNIGNANTRFAGDDVVNTNGLDVVLEPTTVRSRVIASGFVSTTINATGTLPAAKATPTITEFGPPNPTP